MEIVILAGGLGTRLSNVVSDVPKPMAVVNGKPFLEYVLNQVARYDAKRVVLAVGYKSEVIESYFGNDYLGMELVYSKEVEPLGTGGAIKQALQYCNSNDVAIINGDTFFDVDLVKMLEFHHRHQSDITLALKYMTQFDRYGSVVCDLNNKVIRFEEKKYMESGNINGGVYIINKDILKNIPNGKFSFENIVLESMSNLMYGYPSEAYFIDIGIPEDYEKAKKYFSLGGFIE